jgi:hypothetical protein
MELQIPRLSERPREPLFGNYIFCFEDIRDWSTTAPSKQEFRVLVETGGATVIDLDSVYLCKDENKEAVLVLSSDKHLQKYKQLLTTKEVPVKIVLWKWVLDCCTSYKIFDIPP